VPSNGGVACKIACSGIPAPGFAPTEYGTAHYRVFYTPRLSRLIAEALEAKDRERDRLRAALANLADAAGAIVDGHDGELIDYAFDGEVGDCQRAVAEARTALQGEADHA